MSKTTLTSQQFLDLIKKSQIVKDMKSTDVQLLLQLAKNPSSEKARTVYNVLLEEEKRFAHSEKVFHKIVNNVMDKMDAGFTDLKVKAKKGNIESLQKNVRKEEEKEADALLKQLSQK